MMIYWQPGEYHHDRWPTTDHIMPWKVFAMRFQNVLSLIAQERLNVARGISLALADPTKNRPARDRDLAEAFPDA